MLVGGLDFGSQRRINLLCGFVIGARLVKGGLKVGQRRPSISHTANNSIDRFGIEFASAPLP